MFSSRGISVCIKVHNVWGHHGDFEPGKAQYSTPNFFDLIETQNLGMAQAFGALPVVALLMLGVITCIFGVIIRSATVDFQMMCDLVKFNSKYFA